MGNNNLSIFEGDYSYWDVMNSNNAFPSMIVIDKLGNIIIKDNYIPIETTDYMDRIQCALDGGDYCNNNCCPPLGDVSNDGFWNVLDIVTLANCVVDQNCGG